MTEDARPRWQQVTAKPTRVLERQAVTHVLPPGAGTKHARTALANEVQALAQAPEGQRNNQLNESAFNLFQLVAGGYLPYEEVYSSLHTTAMAVGLEDAETRSTLGSAYRGGSETPRVVADLEPTEVPEATTYTGPTLVMVPGPEDAPEVELGIAEKFPLLDWAELWADETEEEWVAYPLLPARRLVALFSPPKVGKSLLMLEIAVQVARGQEVLGYAPGRPRRVLYVDFENDPRGDVRTRLQDMGRTPEDLENLCYLSYPRLAFLDTYVGGLELLAVVEHYRVEVVVIDTISRAVTGEENDNDTWLGFYRNTGLALKAAGVATIRLDHTGKDSSKGMRGGSAKYGDVDAVWAMTKLADTKFHLECTANRLPIAEKTLVLERHTGPLRHTVTTQRTGDVKLDEARRIAAVMDEMDLPIETGHDRAVPRLKEMGVPFTHQQVRDACKLRKERDQEPDDPFVYRGL